MGTSPPPFHLGSLPGRVRKLGFDLVSQASFPFLKTSDLGVPKPQVLSPPHPGDQASCFEMLKILKLVLVELPGSFKEGE